MACLVPAMGMAQELPQGEPGGGGDQQPVERHRDERPAKPAKIADPDGLESRRHAAAIAQQQHGKADAGGEGAGEFRPRGRKAAAGDLGGKKPRNTGWSRAETTTPMVV